MAAPTYRHVSADDIDRVLYVPFTVYLDAEDTVLTTEEDVYQNYDAVSTTMARSRLEYADYAVYCDVHIDNFYAPGMDWKYKVVRVQETGEVAVRDDGVGPSGVLASSALSQALAATHARFIHYRQANSFFKYSFRVGDPFYVAATAPDREAGRQVQLWALYFDKDTGAPVPYMISVDNPDSPNGEDRYFMYVPAGGSGPVGRLSPAPAFQDEALTQLLCPPDPEFLEHGPLATHFDSSGAPVVRNVPGGLTTYDAQSFVPYDQSRYSLLLYHVTVPPDSLPYQGDRMYVAYMSRSAVMPSRDLTLLQMLQGMGATARSFTLASPAPPPDGQVHDFLEPGSRGPRLHYPPSYMEVAQAVPPSAPAQDLPTRFPLAFDTLNRLEPAGDGRLGRLHPGVRLMQLVSEYLFDSSTARELSYFPFLASESASLVQRVVQALAARFRASDVARESVLQQLLVKHGKRYFEEYAVFDGTAQGWVRDVVQRLDEVTYFVSVSIISRVSTQTKDRVEGFTLQNLPIVMRVYNPGT